jgi:predicted small lipoprotein YifL
MTVFPPHAGRVLLIAGILALSLTACGRRGPLEAPPSAAAATPRGDRAAAQQAQAAADEEAEENEAREQGETFLPSPTPRARSTARTLPVVPKTPFILDPLL